MTVNLKKRVSCPLSRTEYLVSDLLPLTGAEFHQPRPPPPAQKSAMNENGKIPQIINLLSTVLRGIRLNINALPFTLAPRDTKVLLSQINIKVNSVIQSFHSLYPFECT